MDADEPINDPATWRRFQAGDHQTFAAVVCCHEARLRAVVARLVAEAQDVVDIVQDCYLKAYRHRGDVLPDRPIYPWLRSIARNLAVNYLRDAARRRDRHRAAARMIAHCQDAMLPESTDDGRLLALRACLDQLEPDPRQLLEARFCDGRPLPELARDLGAKPGTVAMRLLRLRELLRGCVERRLEGAV